MKTIMGIIPVKDRFFLDKALLLVKPGIEELVAITNGEDSYFKVTSELYSGMKQLELIYEDTEDIPDDKHQMAVIGKLLNNAPGFLGFVIIELWQNSLHVYQTYLLPQYRALDVLHQAYTKIESQAKLLGAPYISLCTNEVVLAQRFGFSPTYSMMRKKIERG